MRNYILKPMNKFILLAYSKMKYILIIYLICFPFTTTSQNSIIIDDGRTIKIPVVFHIIPTKDTNIPERISNEIIQRELKEINENYSAKNDKTLLHEDFIELVGNPNISFHLAELDDTDNENRGIIRYEKPIKVKHVKSINPKKYLNILIGDFGSASDVLLTKSIPKPVKINYRSVGDRSNTITHEVGHYLGLWHVWGSGNCRKIKTPWRNKSDYISDTPQQGNCTDVKREKSCPPINIEKTPNYNNFMDYSSCRCFFTIEQAKTMRSKIIKFQQNLYTNSGG